MTDYGQHFIDHLAALRPPYTPSSTGLRVYASEAGGCDRALYYRLKHTQSGEDDHPASVTDAVVWHIGNNLHDEWQAMMARLYPDNFTGEVKWKFPEPPALPLVSGRCDGLYTDLRDVKLALEIKTMTRFKFEKSVKAGRPYMKHTLQAALSQYMLGAQEVHIVYLCKDWLAPGMDNIMQWNFPISANIAIAELNREARILKRVKEGHPPPGRIMQGEEITNIDKEGECKFCPFRDLCEMRGA